MIKELLINKANIEATNKNGDKPLICGIFLNKLLIFTSFNFFYFLFKASRNGNHEVVRELLQNKANIESIDKNGCTSLYCGIFLN